MILMIIQTKAGYREFYNFVGGSEAHVHYSISSRADMMLKGGMNADGTVLFSLAEP